MLFINATLFKIQLYKLKNQDDIEFFSKYF